MTEPPTPIKDHDQVLSNKQEHLHPQGRCGATLPSFLSVDVCVMIFDVCSDF